jgi:hypothetical protein
MAEILDTVLLLALPASGKSEVRRYLAHQDAPVCARDFHMGPTVQLDDFPYVHMMRRIDDELVKLGRARAFFHAPDKPFQDAKSWIALIELVNEDYRDMLSRKLIESTASAGLALLDRFDAADLKAGVQNRLVRLSVEMRRKLAEVIEKDARSLVDQKQACYPETLEGKTLVIEFARGGPEGARPPLPEGMGYRASLNRLAPEILEKAAVLYIWVTPAESRRKNAERADPNDPGSILHHGVPQEVMIKDYGCDDIDWLEKISDKPGTITIESHGRTFHLPLARFDNRVDRTSFARKNKRDWSREEVEPLHDGLKNALERLLAGRRRAGARG